MLCIRSIWGMRHSVFVQFTLHSSPPPLPKHTLLLHNFFPLPFMMPLFTFRFEILPSASSSCAKEFVMLFLVSIFCFSRESYSKVVKHIRTEGIRANTLIDQRESEICFIALNNQRIFLDHIRGKRMMMMMKKKKSLKKKVSTFSSDKKKVWNVAHLNPSPKLKKKYFQIFLSDGNKVLDLTLKRPVNQIVVKKNLDFFRTIVGGSFVSRN